MDANQPPPSHTIPFQFTGKVGEYFNIWIVNLSLSIITLGIYSAWAKVRRKRYLYSNTLLDNTPFEYLAQPIAILKGRLIAFGVIAIYSAITRLYSQTELLFGLAFLILLPWVVIQSLCFNARNSSYRNIRFDFRANYKEALLLVLGLTYPWKKKFVIGHSTYGTTPFACEARASGFYFIYLKALGLFALLLVFGTVVSAFVLRSFGFASIFVSSFGNVSLFTMVIGVVTFLALMIYTSFAAYLSTAATNLAWNSTVIAGNRFQSTLRTPQTAWLYFSNAMAIIFSLGLLIPWVSIRMARYQLAHLSLVAQEDLDGFIAKVDQGKLGAAGEEIGDMLGFDIGL